MIKKYIFLFSLLFCAHAHATDLLDAYRAALCSDPIYKQALAQKFYDQEGVPISLSSLLPNLNAVVMPSLQKIVTSGPGSTSPTTQRGMEYTLTLNQTIFDFGKIANLQIANDVAMQAEATFNAAAQDLMIRVAKAYFSVLRNEENLRALHSASHAYNKQLEQVREQYKVGVKTITDVYTAEASYQTSLANVAEAEMQLYNAKNDLSIITGSCYPCLAKLGEHFPFVTPRPCDPEAWVNSAQMHNWSILAARYAAEAARNNIKQRFAGHLPTLNLQAYYDSTLVNTLGNQVVVVVPGGALSKVHTRSVQLNLNIPIVEGGLVVAQTRQAQYNYQIAFQQLEQTFRNTLNLARQSYAGILSGIAQINADQKAIFAARASLEGMQAQYSVGTEILVNVLNQQQKVLNAELEYATDRFNYLNNLLALKQAAGTLNPNDLVAINCWLIDSCAPPCKPCQTHVAEIKQQPSKTVLPKHKQIVRNDIKEESASLA